MRLLLGMTLMLPFVAFGGSIEDSFSVQKEKMVQYFKDKGPCYIALGRAYGESKDRFWNEVLCVMDIKDKSASINAKSGCALVLYDVQKGTIKGTNRGPTGHTSIVTANKFCGDGGLWEIFEKETITGSKIFIKETLVTGKGTTIQPPELLYTRGPGYQSAYSDLIKEIKK